MGNWVVVNYDDLPYPGIVVSVDDGDLEVKVIRYMDKTLHFQGKCYICACTRPRLYEA